jgi:hypothetical protein
LKNLKLITRHKYMNMTLLDEHKIQVIYDDPGDDFCSYVFCAYERMQKKTLERMQEKVAHMELLYLFILDVVEKRLKVRGRLREDLHNEMRSKSYLVEFLKELIDSLMKERLADIAEKVARLKVEVSTYASIHPEESTSLS